MLNSGNIKTKQQIDDFKLRLLLAIMVASVGTREAPWYAAYCEALQFFLAVVITTTVNKIATVIFPQYPIPKNFDLDKDNDFNEGMASDISALPPSPTIGRGKGASKPATNIGGSPSPVVSHRIPDFARKRFILPFNDCSGDNILAERLDLLVENKGLASEDNLAGQLGNARVQSDQQAAHAFHQDSNINVVGVITAAGRYFRYHETHRSELALFGTHFTDGDADEFFPKRLPLFPREGAPSPENRKSQGFLLQTPHKKAPLARYTDEKSQPDTDENTTSPFPPGFRPEVYNHMHAFEFKLQDDYAIEVGKDCRQVFDIGFEFEKLAEIFGKIGDRLLTFDKKQEAAVMQLFEDKKGKGQAT
ncbi:hypothetical protein HGRIS_013949 [Hohenbuehelia grisea]|uniref:Uncharacterized protein n=1 Tax=Hohenbuehelia grisea TaxID=104357 RepID=A0ABR3JRX5_9AGAR